jgi:hypothetical protein
MPPRAELGVIGQRAPDPLDRGFQLDNLLDAIGHKGNLLVANAVAEPHRMRN